MIKDEMQKQGRTLALLLRRIDALKDCQGELGSSVASKGKGTSDR